MTQTTTTEALDLRAIIQDKLKSSNLADPREIAIAIIDDGDLSADNYAEALSITLPNYVREQVRTTRAISLDPQPRSGKTNKSSRWSATKDASGVLLQRIYTGSNWIILGDATREDIRGVISEYSRRANENQVAAQRYGRLESLFDKHAQATSVRGLPIKEITKALA